jgi:DNA-binding PadR family transcriptional regulator
MAQRVTPAETRGALAESANLLSRFELAPPRGFLLPGILLLLSEEPGYGYNLVKGLKEFRFGRVDRPSVYRALAQLEADGLVESWSEASKAGNPRHVYRLTGLGEDVLRAWMGVIKEEHACLARVLQRYQATGTGDAVLAGVDGGWANVLGWPWSPVSTTSPMRARTRPARLGPPAAGVEWAVESFRRAGPFSRVDRSPFDRRPDQLRCDRRDRMDRDRGVDRGGARRCARAASRDRAWTGCARGTAFMTPGSRRIDAAIPERRPSTCASATRCGRRSATASRVISTSTA